MANVGSLVSLVVVGMLVGGALLLGLDLALRRRARVRTDARQLLLLAGTYALVLVTTGPALPRRVLAPGEPDCFGGWCVAGGQATREAAGPSACGPTRGDVWLVTLDLFSQGWSARQRASHARVAIEDGEGHHYAPCAPGAGASLSDRLEPGQSLTVTVPVALPPGRPPAGAVVRHGSLADAMMLGSDEAVLHPPALLRLTVR